VKAWISHSVVRPQAWTSAEEFCGSGARLPFWLYPGIGACEGPDAWPDQDFCRFCIQFWWLTSEYPTWSKTSVREWIEARPLQNQKGAGLERALRVR
jgi:hypothetical protein